MYTKCTMSLLADHERSFLEAVSNLAFCNPFLPERTKYERLALGDSFVEGEPVWSMAVDHPDRPRANVWRVIDRLDPLIQVLRKRLQDGKKASPSELALYEDGVLHLLYQRYYHRFVAAGLGPESSKPD